MRVRRSLLIAYGLNALSWIICWTWLLSSAVPVPTSAADYIDRVYLPITRDIYVPHTHTPLPVLIKLFQVVQSPAFIIGIALIPRPSTDQFFLGPSLIVWRLLLTTALSFVQWYGMMWLFGSGKQRWRARTKGSR